MREPKICEEGIGDAAYLNETGMAHVGLFSFRTASAKDCSDFVVNFFYSGTLSCAWVPWASDFCAGHEVLLSTLFSSVSIPSERLEFISPLLLRFRLPHERARYLRRANDKTFFGSRISFIASTKETTVSSSAAYYLRCYHSSRKCSTAVRHNARTRCAQQKLTPETRRPIGDSRAYKCCPNECVDARVERMRALAGRRGQWGAWLSGETHSFHHPIIVFVFLS